MLSVVVMHCTKEIEFRSSLITLLCNKSALIYRVVAVLGAQLLFLHQLTHNMTKACSLNYKFST